MNFNFSNKVKQLRPSAIREIFKSLQDPSIISFAAGNPSPLSFPIDKLSHLSEKIFSEQAVFSLQYGITEGYEPFRIQIQTRLKERFSIGREYDRTIIVSGGQQGIDLTCKALCNEGDVVICEDPSFIGALNAFRSSGAVLVGVEMEDDGISIEKLEQALKDNPNTKMLYLIPTFQNPSGITMSLEKRKAVLKLAEKYNVPILEDNPYGELRFSGEDLPTLKSLDTNGLVIYCGSFSKILSAGMRIGFLCGQEELIQKVVVLKQTNDVHTNLFFQILCSRFIDEYNLDEHIDGVKKLYGHKCGLMLEQMDKTFPEFAKYTRPSGGLFLWCTLPYGTNMEEFISNTIASKVAVVPGSAFLSDTTQQSFSFRLNYSMPSDEQIVQGISALAKVIEQTAIKNI